MLKLSLRYSGPLHSGDSTYKVNEKHDIRAAFHPQLYAFCRSLPHTPRSLHTLTIAPLSEWTLKGNVIQGQERGIRIAGFVRVGGYECVPIITRASDQDVSITIRLHRREGPGAVIHNGGDLDGRIKTLFDALRMPHHADELRPGDPPAHGRQLFCLLEDDSLITALEVETHQLFTPLVDEDRKTDVEADIYVEISDREYA